ncbi:hypothetical protein BgiBS90_022249 [Biomphalaria glabrata]|nr:hypothetical protein BgiBS90_022249 [Biomphalaria glabrata]
MLVRWPASLGYDARAQPNITERHDGLKHIRGSRAPPPLKTGNTRGCESGGQHPPGATLGPSPLSQSATMASCTNGGVVPPTKTRKVTVPGGKARGRGTPSFTKTRKVNAPGGKARESGALPPGYDRSKQLRIIHLILNWQFSLKRIEVSTIAEQYEADVLLCQETLRSDEGPPLLYGFTATGVPARGARY